MHRILLFFCFILICVDLQAQQRFPLNMSDSEIVALCFDAEWRAKDTACYWQPRLWERWKLREDDTQEFTTKIDTAFEYTHTYNRYYEKGGIPQRSKEVNQYRTILTYTHGEHTDWCRACCPLMSLIVLEKKEENNYWELLNFNKYAEEGGEFGRRPERQVIYISPEIKALRFDVHSSSSSSHEHHLSIYVLGNEALSILAGFGNTNAAEPSEACNFNTTISIDTSKQQIHLHRSGTECSKTWFEDRATIPVEEHKIYQFEYFFGGRYKLKEIK